ncbi:MAG: AsmA family protein [Candidatus Hydrogenedentota bacterium]|nr:MAG: AsmA family protein [Candidatus Hydrogenedentota bacterium]
MSQETPLPLAGSLERSGCLRRKPSPPIHRCDGAKDTGKRRKSEEKTRGRHFSRVRNFLGDFVETAGRKWSNTGVKRFVKWVGFAAVVLAALIVGLLFIRFDLSEWKGGIETGLTDLTGREVTLRGISLRLIEGIRIEGIEMANREGFSDTPFVRSEGLVLKYELLPLLSKRLEVNRVELLRTSFLIERNRKGEFNFDDLLALAEKKPEEKPVELPSFVKELSLRISRIGTTNADVTFVDHLGGAKKTGRLEGIDLNASEVLLKTLDESKGGALANLSMKGTLGIAKMAYAGFHAGPLSGEFELADGHFKLPNLTLRAYKGTVSGSAEVDLTKKLTEYRIATAVRGLDPNILIAQRLGFKGTMLGALTHNGTVRGTSAGLKSLNGKGEYEVAPGKLSHIPALEKAADLLGLETLRSLQYSALKGTYTIEKGVLITPDATLVAVGLLAKADGKVNLVKETMDYIVSIKLSPEMANQIRSKRLSMIPRDDDGGLTIEIGLRGPITDPKVDFSRAFKNLFKNIFRGVLPSGDALKSAPGKALEGVKGGVGQGLEKLKGLF